MTAFIILPAVVPSCLYEEHNDGKAGSNGRTKRRWIDISVRDEATCTTTKRLYIDSLDTCRNSIIYTNILKTR